MSSSSSTNEVFEIIIGAPQYPVRVKLPIAIPSHDDPSELAHRVIQHHNLPIFMHQGKIYIYITLYSSII